MNRLSRAKNEMSVRAYIEMRSLKIVNPRSECPKSSTRISWWFNAVHWQRSKTCGKPRFHNGPMSLFRGRSEYVTPIRNVHAWRFRIRVKNSGRWGKLKHVINWPTKQSFTSHLSDASNADLLPFWIWSNVYLATCFTSTLCAIRRHTALLNVFKLTPLIAD